MSDPNFNPGCFTSARRAPDGNYLSADGKTQTYALNLPVPERCGFTSEQEGMIKQMIQAAVSEAIGNQPSNRKGKEEE
jgi:hypothetical protein